jgi:thiol:disulfide interchange protein DsbD
MKRTAYWIVALCLCVFALPAVANQVTARILSPTTAVVPGETYWFALALEIEPGWNTYWKNPGTTGLPPVLTVNAQTPELLFPTPVTKPFGGDTNLLTYGYVDEVVHPFQLSVPETATSHWQMEGEARWLVCQDICIPESQTVSRRLSVVQDPLDTQRTPELTQINTARGQIPSDFPGAANFQGPQSIWISGLQDVTIVDVMPEASGEVLGLVERTNPLDGGTQVIFDRPVSEADLSSTQWLIGTTDGGIRVNWDPTLATPESGASQLSLGLVLIMALAGGLILNLMPCVFPVLSIKALSIAAQSSKSRRDVQRGAWLYTTGILVSMLSLAAVMVALKAGGAQIGWGFQLQTPWFVAALVYVFVILGLWLYGWIEFGGQLAGMGQELTEGTGGRAEFFTGVLAVVVATPCTAPFMGVAMGYTLTQPWWVTLIVFAALGFGLALPMLVFAVAPETAKRLPRPGNWMIRLKQFLAFPIFATAVWLLWVLVQQTSADMILLMLGGLLCLIFGLWLRRGESKLAQTLSLVVVVVSLGALPAVSQMNSQAATAQTIEVDAEPYSSSALRAHVESGQSVFVNMTADWCITCKVNEQRLLKTSRVDELFREHAVTRMTGDWTRYDASITEYLNQYDRVGVPLYVVHHPNQDPIVLSEFPGFAELKAAITARSSL